MQVKKLQLELDMEQKTGSKYRKESVKAFGIVNEAEVDVFLDFPCFLCDATDVGNFMSSSSTFSKPSLYLEVLSSCSVEV